MNYKKYRSKNKYHNNPRIYPWMIWFLCCLHCTCLSLALPASTVCIHWPPLPSSAISWWRPGVTMFDIVQLWVCLCPNILSCIIEWWHTQDKERPNNDDCASQRAWATTPATRGIAIHTRGVGQREAAGGYTQRPFTRFVICTNPTKIRWICIILMLVSNNESSCLVDQPSYHIHGKLSKRGSLFCNFCSLWLIAGILWNKLFFIPIYVQGNHPTYI